MAATGASPTYFNYDNFEEIQVSTAGNDIKSRTGGMGLNLVVKRGTNQFRGRVRGYFDNDAMESSNVPDELAAAGVTHETVRSQQADLGLRLRARRPDLPDKAWFYGSYSIQDVRLVRRAGALVDRTQLKNPNVKVNWQATQEGQRQLPVLRRLQDQGRPQPRRHAASCSTRRRRRSTRTTPTTDIPLHGLWKIADDHAFGIEPVRVGECTPTTTPASSSIRSAGSTCRPAATSSTAHVVRLGQPEPQRAAAAHRQRRRAVVPERDGRLARRQVRRRLPHAWTRSAARSGRATCILANERAGQPAGAGVPRGPRRQPRQLPELLRRRHDRARTA